MNVSLTPQLEKFVNTKVKSGRYNSASEVVREALRCLRITIIFERSASRNFEQQ
jgi:putative addiction module CopG family antidote